MIERLISIVLRTGVLLSMAVIILGVVLTFAHHPDYFRSRPALGELTNATATYPHTIRDVVRGVAASRGQAIAMVGILLLIATPIVRVGLSTALFAVQKDRLYTAITFGVLVLLLVSFASGLS